MTLSEILSKMNLTELTCFQQALQTLAHARRAELVNQLIANRGVIGVIQPVKKKGTRKVVRRVRVNAMVKEYSRGKLKAEVIEPEGFAGQSIEVSEELVYERFGSPG